MHTIDIGHLQAVFGSPGRGLRQYPSSHVGEEVVERHPRIGTRLVWIWREGKVGRNRHSVYACGRAKLSLQKIQPSLSRPRVRGLGTEHTDYALCSHRRLEDRC